MKKFWLVVLPTVALVGIVWQTLSVCHQRRLERERRAALVERLDRYLDRRLVERAEYAEILLGRHGVTIDPRVLVSLDESWATSARLTLETAPIGRTITPTEWAAIESRLKRLEQPQEGRSVTVGAAKR